MFWGVAMRPGKPLSFAVRGRTLVFGLPGNPVSSLVGALLFVGRPCSRSRGRAGRRHAGSLGSLGTVATRNATRDDFARARLRLSAERAVLDPIAGQESHMIVRAAGADALVHVPRGEGVLPEGAPVRYLALTP